MRRAAGQRRLGGGGAAGVAGRGAGADAPAAPPAAGRFLGGRRPLLQPVWRVIGRGVTLLDEVTAGPGTEGEQEQLWPRRSCA
jgi:hypothetical protein